MSSNAPIDYWTPERHLSLTGVFEPGQLILSDSVQRSEDAVFVADFLGLDGSGGGIIAEFGGESNGTYCGFETDGSFLFRSGSGGDISQSTVHAVQLPAGTIGGNGQLTVEIKLNVARAVRIWWNGRLVGVPGIDKTPLTIWAGANHGYYMQVPTSGEVVGDHVETYLPVSVHTSELRYYAAQSLGV